MDEIDNSEFFLALLSDSEIIVMCFSNVSCNKFFLKI